MTPGLMNVIAVEPGKKPYMIEIPNDLESLQHEVGGYIEAVYPYEDSVALICDEEGKMKGKELNRAIRDEEGYIADIIAGRFLVVGLGEEDFTSVPEELQAKYMELFEYPEKFTKIDDKIIAIPIGEISRNYDRTADIPLYRHDRTYALYHGQFPEYKCSYGANVACKEAIEKAIKDFYLGNRLLDACTKEVLSEFGKDRVEYVLANTIRQKSWDGRIREDNKQWANTISVTNDPSNIYFVIDKVHPGLLDIFANQIRRGDERPSVLGKLNSLPEQKSKSAVSVHREEER